MALRARGLYIRYFIDWLWLCLPLPFQDSRATTFGTCRARATHSANRWTRGIDRPYTQLPLIHSLYTHIHTSASLSRSLFLSCTFSLTWRASYWQNVPLPISQSIIERHCRVDGNRIEIAVEMLRLLPSLPPSLSLAPLLYLLSAYPSPLPQPFTFLR